MADRLSEQGLPDPYSARVVSGNSSQNGRPARLAVAFWCQLAVAGLLVVLAVVNGVAALLFRQLFADAPALPSGELLSLAALLCLAAWLVAAGLGLRRRSRTAYGLSVAGLALPLLITAVTMLGIGGTYRQTFGSPSSGGRAVFTLTERLAPWTIMSHVVNGIAAIIGPVLIVATIGMLTTGACRRFFRHQKVGRGGAPGHR